MTEQEMEAVLFLLLKDEEQRKVKVREWYKQNKEVIKPGMKAIYEYVAGRKRISKKSAEYRKQLLDKYIELKKTI